jgi:hypothetical protein
MEFGLPAHSIVLCESVLGSVQERTVGNETSRQLTIVLLGFMSGMALDSLADIS